MWTQHYVSFLLIYLASIQACLANFTFTYSEATECDDFHVSWSGGTPPFTITLIPSFQSKIVWTPADSDFINNQGSYVAPMPLNASHEIVVVMSDATGFGSGGASPVITVGKSIHNSTCDTRDDPQNHFTFSATNALIQCNGFVFSEYDDAVQPVTITGVVAGGSTFVLNPPKGSKTFDWVANVAAGTELLFFMTDSQSRQGGTSNLLTVQNSQESSCLDSSSPASATHAPSMTGTATSIQTGSVSASSSSSHLKTGTLIAVIVAPVVAVVLVVAALIWYRHRRRNSGVRVLGRRSQKPELDLAKGDSDSSQHIRDLGSPTSSAPFLHGRSPSADGVMTSGSYSPRLPTSATTSQFTEFLPPASVYSDSTQSYQYGSMSAYGSSNGASSQYGGAPSPPAVNASGTGHYMRPDGDSGARRKAAEAGVLTPPGHQPPTQFVLHTDIEDSVPPPVHEVIELPPQYSERRAGPAAASGLDPQPNAGESSSS